ncbi:hypothetical protein [Clostridium fungisolvens]|uniref:Lipoprotein n=1 Tax=Clostridium fungisolvens TaxID=1604897 RepID=A0A6V8SJQ1_9CLOT|nr:hypothetical protein [Clostridium fungisolvens]GFP75378.1 hypothetical protein bsdtw1_01455 [Clostridium fungisolvens]
MNLKSFIFVLFSLAMLLVTGCSKPINKETLKPFSDIQVSSTKRVEFDNMTITSAQKESGRSKMVIRSDDITKIAEYLKTIDCVSVNQKEKKADFIIGFMDNEEQSNNSIRSIVFSKNQIYVYKNSGTETTELCYTPVDNKVVEKLKSLYSSMNYEEELLMKK